MNTTQIAKTVKFTTTDVTEYVKVNHFEIGHNTHPIIFELNCTEKTIIREISTIIRDIVNNMKHTDQITIGGYRIICEEIGLERIVYANDEILSKRKVSLY